MLARTYSATLLGLQPQKIEVEVTGLRGIPGLTFIGLPSKTVTEAKERISAAIKNSGIRIKSFKTIVNLAPVDLKKETSHLELAIAIGLLKMNGWLKKPTDQSLFLGELSLDGSLKAISGALPLVIAAKELGFKEILLPTQNLPEVAIVKDIQIRGLSHLTEYLHFDRGQNALTQVSAPILFSKLSAITDPLMQIHGQAQAKRALMICAAGGHNLLMTGPPGIGKSMLAAVLPQLLPPLNESEILEVNSLLSACGLLSDGLQKDAPFRAPHYSISAVGLIGGGPHMKPGEITLANRGILFLDELSEFKTTVLQTLRQPLEHGQISLNNGRDTCLFPARFTLVAATNPCPCGYAGVSQKTCICSQNTQERYAQKISGPLKDRIDLHVRITKNETPTTKYANQSAWQEIKKQVAEARKKQYQRWLKLENSPLNAHISNAQISSFCHLQSEAEKLLIRGADALQLSNRAFYKTIKIAQTLADLESEKMIASHHIAEALQFRAENVKSA